MVRVQIPSLAEVASGIGHVANGACEMASNTVQAFVTSPSVAQAGLTALAQQIEALEALVVQLHFVAEGIDEVQAKLTATKQLEWHSPAGEAFRESLGYRKAHAQQLALTARETAGLARHSIAELQAMIAGLQSLLATARAAAGQVASEAIGQVC